MLNIISSGYFGVMVFVGFFPPEKEPKAHFRQQRQMSISEVRNEY